MYDDDDDPAEDWTWYDSFRTEKDRLRDKTIWIRRFYEEAERQWWQDQSPEDFAKLSEAGRFRQGEMGVVVAAGPKKTFMRHLCVTSEGRAWVIAEHGGIVEATEKWLDDCRSRFRKAWREYEAASPDKGYETVSVDQPDPV